MSFDNIRPQTIAGIKQLAKTIRRTDEIPHCKALDEAANVVGYQNYRHLQNSNFDETTKTHNLYITVYWYDKEARLSGYEVLNCRLPCSLIEVCKKSRLKYVRQLSGFRLVSDDHLVCDDRSDSKDQAQRIIRRAASSIYFMHATRLMPLLHSDVKNLKYQTPPYHDHGSQWYHCDSGSFFLLDEPYDAAIAGEEKSEERENWAKNYSWLFKRVDWHGLYNPGHCPLYIATKSSNSVIFKKVITAINLMPNIVDTLWEGQSNVGYDTFISPLGENKNARRRAVPKFRRISVASKTTIPLSIRADSNRRPNGIMSIEDHKRVGQSLKTMIASRIGVYSSTRKLNRVRSILEDWMESEVRPTRMPDGDFFDVYYRNPATKGRVFELAQTDSGCLQLATEIKQTLESYYPNCEPLRTITSLLMQSIPKPT